MAKDKPKRTKDQLIIDPVLIHMGKIIKRLTNENKKLKIKIAELKVKKLKILKSKTIVK